MKRIENTIIYLSSIQPIIQPPKKNCVLLHSFVHFEITWLGRLTVDLKWSLILYYVHTYIYLLHIYIYTIRHPLFSEGRKKESFCAKMILTTGEKLKEEEGTWCCWRESLIFILGKPPLSSQPKNTIKYCSSCCFPEYLTQLLPTFKVEPSFLFLLDIFAYERRPSSNKDFSQKE